MRRLALTLLSCHLALGFAPAPLARLTRKTKVFETGSGLRYQDLKAGDGDVAKNGDMVEVHYTVWLAKDGKQIDSSVDRKQTFAFRLGIGQVIKGWDEGFAGMKAGGKRKLLVPANLAYGGKGLGDLIPPDTDLIFDVEVVSVK